MDLEQRKNNDYFDQRGKQILVGDLLKVFHFRTRRRKYYIYFVVVMEETEPFPIMAVKSHYANKPHCRMYVLANNSQRIYIDAKIIGDMVFDLPRKKIKVNIDIENKIT